MESDMVLELQEEKDEKEDGDAGHDAETGQSPRSFLGAKGPGSKYAHFSFWI